MRLTLASLALISLSTPAVAEPVSMRLSLNVPVRCAVLNLEMVDQAKGHLRVQATCNVHAFGVYLAGLPQDRAIQSATATGANVAVSGNSLRVTSNRVGTYSFDVLYDGSLDHEQPIRAEVRAL